MKRRSFLSLLGAALTAPVIPASAGASGLSARAALHARTYPCVSAVGLSRGLGVPMTQAQALLRDLSAKGLVGPVSHAGTGPIYAASEVYRPAVEAAVRSVQVTRAAKAQKFGWASPATHPPQDWLSYLRCMCESHGYALSPRALAVTA